jgi:hypothetical protein
MEPSCAVAWTVLRRFRRRVPPVICLSIYPREAVDAPHETVAFLQKPTSSAQLGAALAAVGCA